MYNRSNASPRDGRASGRLRLRAARRFCLLLSVGLISVFGGFESPLTAMAQESDSRVKNSQDPPHLKSLEGRWFASPLDVQWAIETWGNACGPKPSGGGESAGGVIVSQRGAELSFFGAGRSFSTAGCYEQYPGMNRVSHSASKRSWSSVCQTPADAPRHVTVRSSVRANDSSIQFSETGQHRFSVGGTSCRATSRRSRDFTLLQRAGEPTAGHAPSTQPSPGQAKPEAPARQKTATKQIAAVAKPRSEDDLLRPSPARQPCAPPGPASKLQVEPSRKLMRPGEEFAFRTSVTDADGCRLSNQLVKWELEPALPEVELKPEGHVVIAPNAGDAHFEMVASVGGERLIVSVQVVSEARYESLLGAGVFGIDGESATGSELVLNAGAIGSSTAVAEDAAASRKAWFIGLSVTLALVLGGLGLISVRSKPGQPSGRTPPEGVVTPRPPLARRRRPRPEPVPGEDKPPKVCPVCGTLYSGNAQFCGRDGSALVQVN